MHEHGNKQMPLKQTKISMRPLPGLMTFEHHADAHARHADAHAHHADAHAHHGTSFTMPELEMTQTGVAMHKCMHARTYAPSPVLCL